MNVCYNTLPAGAPKPRQWKSLAEISGGPKPMWCMYALADGSGRDLDVDLEWHLRADVTNMVVVLLNAGLDPTEKDYIRYATALLPEIVVRFAGGDNWVWGMPDRGTYRPN